MLTKSQTRFQVPFLSRTPPEHAGDSQNPYLLHLKKSAKASLDDADPIDLLPRRSASIQPPGQADNGLSPLWTADKE